METKKTIGWTLEVAKRALDVYTKAELQKHFGIYTKVFLKEEEKWLLKQDSRMLHAVKLALEQLAQKKTNKDASLTYNALPFLSPESFNLFLKYLPKDTVTVLEHIVLNGPIGYKEIETTFGIEAHVLSSKADWKNSFHKKPSPGLRFFSIEDQEYYSYRRNRSLVYYLPFGMRELILPLLFPEPHPVGSYSPQPDRKEEKVFLGEAFIQDEMPGLLIRLQQKPLKLTKKGRPSIASVRSIGRKLKIQEFYADTEQDLLKHIRACSVLGLLVQTQNWHTDSIIELIKELFAHEFIQKFHLPIHLLNYINGVSKLDEYYFTQCGEVYLDLISSLPQGTWIAYKELEYSLRTQLFAVSPVRTSGTYNLYVDSLDPEAEYSFEREVNIHPYWTEKLFMWPSFRAAMFVMASWGIIDMIYEEPDLSNLTITANSPYDGIKAIRLNELGAYVLGLTEKYESNIKPPFTLELDPDSLSILLMEGDHERAGMAISSFAKPLGDRRFYTDAKLFLGDCKSAEDLTHKDSNI